MRALIAIALEHNRDLRAMVLRVGEARAVRDIRRADPAPRRGRRARQPADLNVTGRPLTTSQYQVGPSVATWELDFWGHVRSLNRAALENFLATDEARRAATLSLVAELANAYLTLRELDERHALAARIMAAFFPPHFNPSAITALADIDPRLAAGKYTFVLDLPPDFQRDVLRGRAPTIQLNIDATRMSQARVSGAPSAR